MKTIIFSLALLLVVVNSFSQAPVNTGFSKDYYLQKSKNQKTAAWVLLGGGTALTATGLIVGVNAANADDLNSAFNRLGTGGIISSLGLLSMIGSIPFFISAGHNVRKAASISFNNQKVLLPKGNSFIFKTQPALTLKIGL